MGAMNNYKLLLEERARVEKITRSLVLNRLTYLSHVGRSVMNKAHGGDYGWSKKETSFLGEPLNELVRLETPKLIRLEEDAVILEHPKYTAQNPNRTLSIPKRWLHMSDRDFAKFVRKVLKDRKAYERRIALSHAEMDLKRAMKHLEEHRLEITRLENLVKDSKEAKAKDLV